MAKSRSIIFLDEDHNIVSKGNALWKVIHRYENGDLVEEVWVDLNKES